MARRNLHSRNELARVPRHCALPPTTKHTKHRDEAGRMRCAESLVVVVAGCRPCLQRPTASSLPLSLQLLVPYPRFVGARGNHQRERSVAHIHLHRHTCICCLLSLTNESGRAPLRLQPQDDVVWTDRRKAHCWARPLHRFRFLRLDIEVLAERGTLSLTYGDIRTSPLIAYLSTSSTHTFTLTIHCLQRERLGLGWRVLDSRQGKPAMKIHCAKTRK